MILTIVIDIDETFELTKVKAQYQRSRSYRHLCEKIDWAITHEWSDGS